jgi:hypothetical protein
MAFDSSWPRNIVASDCGRDDESAQQEQQQQQQQAKGSEAIERIRKKGAQQAARDVVRLVPIASLHVSNGCYFYLLPTVDNPEPKISVYRVGVNKDITPSSSTM